MPAPSTPEDWKRAADWANGDFDLASGTATIWIDEWRDMAAAFVAGRGSKTTMALPSRLHQQFQEQAFLAGDISMPLDEILAKKSGWIDRATSGEMLRGC